VSYIDIYYIHRLDKVTPIEKTMHALVDLKKQGKIRHIGLSECSANSLRRAQAIHPVTCVQVEYNLFCTVIESPEIDVLKTARELGIGVVAYGPLGSGILSGTLRNREDVSKPGDLRGMIPQLREENFANTVAAVDEISKIAQAKGATPGQLALAWLLAQGDDIFPIPGTTKIHRLRENMESVSVSISESENAKLRELAKGIRGGRVQDMLGFAFGDTPPLE
jgi:aryl-alcohol dehydrogenase-like predicted oxidoreductase